MDERSREWIRCGAFRQQTAQLLADCRIVIEHWDAVARQMDVRFDRGHTHVKRDLKARQSVFRLKTTGATMALQIET